ncbi:MAG: SDR family oxidoreductase [Candidatus Kerfeldbacteria bacterium]|nr:SDR family oxidoreductase [Candidatus Kerfeldbacteria bacterium]
MSKVALITGASGTVGRICTEYFSHNEYDLVVHNVSDGDLTTQEGIASLKKNAEQKYGRVDVVIHTLGDFVSTPLINMSYEDMQRVINTNITSTLLLTQALVPLMQKQGSGRFIFFSAAHAQDATARPRTTLYTIAKSGVATLTQQLANDFATQNITFSCIAPTTIEGAEFPLSTPTRTSITAADLTRTIDFLLSSPHTAVNGTTITLSDGWLPT